MLSIRRYQRFFIFVISFDYNAVITKLSFFLILDVDGYFLAMQSEESSCPHRKVNDMSCNAPDINS